MGEKIAEDESIAIHMRNITEVQDEKNETLLHTILEGSPPAGNVLLEDINQAESVAEVNIASKTTPPCSDVPDSQPDSQDLCNVSPAMCVWDGSTCIGTFSR